MKYDYYDEMKLDIKDYLHDNYIELASDKRSEIEEKLYNELWVSDAVTGNASGSYTFNSYKAKENVFDNTDILAEALTEFCIDNKTIAERFCNEDWEYFDVIIRCYILGPVLSEILDEVDYGRKI